MTGLRANSKIIGSFRKLKKKSTFSLGIKNDVFRKMTFFEKTVHFRFEDRTGSR